ncbi:MAG TPA: hypothetical protein VNH14_00930 [Gemmatimonadales bacterium]|nr:hypothetical protein [Gemmatimonadales bacterium]
MPAYSRSWRVLATAAALTAAACNSNTGPQAHLSNPAQLSADLQTVGSIFTSPAFQSFSALGLATGSPVAATTRVGALLGATPIVPPRTSTQPYANAPARLQALRTAAGALRGGITASVIPPTVLGETFVWDVTTHQYVADPSATPPAPANGVRIILYAVDPVTGAVVEPPVATGYVDLIDLSTGNTNSLQVIVNGGTPASPGTTYANYTVTATVTGSPATAFDATAVGFVSDGTHTLTFNAAFSATNLTTDNPDAQIDVTWSLDNPSVNVALHETLTTPDANDATLAIDFSVTRGAETVRVQGTVTVVVSPATVTANLSITVNGVPFATITGTATATSNNIQARHADGSALSSDELSALQNLFVLPDSLETAIEALFHPCERLMGA